MDNESLRPEPEVGAIQYARDRYSPPSGRLTRRNQRSVACASLRHSTTFTMSSSSRAFFFSAFMGYVVTALPLGRGAQSVHNSSMSGIPPEGAVGVA